MNFTEIVAEVLDLTKRRDKQTQIEQAVNAAISHFCLKTKLYKDLVEASIPIVGTEYSNTIDLSTETTRFRSFKFLKLPGVKRCLTPVATDKLFTPGGTMQTNVYYIIGNDLTIITSSLATSLEVGYYQYPAQLSGTDTHWLADVAPQCIIDKAAARIFKSIGDDAAARIHEGFAMDAYNVVMTDYADSPYSLG